MSPDSCVATVESEVEVIDEEFEALLEETQDAEAEQESVSEVAVASATRLQESLESVARRETSATAELKRRAAIYAMQDRLPPRRYMPWHVGLALRVDLEKMDQLAGHLIASDESSETLSLTVIPRDRYTRQQRIFTIGRQVWANGIRGVPRVSYDLRLAPGQNSWARPLTPKVSLRDYRAANRLDETIVRAEIRRLGMWRDLLDPAATDVFTQALRDEVKTMFNQMLANEPELAIYRRELRWRIADRLESSSLRADVPLLYGAEGKEQIGDVTYRQYPVPLIGFASLDKMHDDVWPIESRTPSEGIMQAFIRDVRQGCLLKSPVTGVFLGKVEFTDACRASPRRLGVWERKNLKIFRFRASDGIEVDYRLPETEDQWTISVPGLFSPHPTPVTVGQPVGRILPPVKLPSNWQAAWRQLERDWEPAFLNTMFFNFLERHVLPYGGNYAIPFEVIAEAATHPDNAHRYTFLGNDMTGVEDLFNESIDAFVLPPTWPEHPLDTLIARWLPQARLSGPRPRPWILGHVRTSGNLWLPGDVDVPLW